MIENLKTKAAVVAAPVLLAAGAANAALPEGVTTAISSAGTDLVTAASAVIVAMVAFWGLRKIGQKMGWF